VSLIRTPSHDDRWGSCQRVLFLFVFLCLALCCSPIVQSAGDCDHRSPVENGGEGWHLWAANSHFLTQPQPPPPIRQTQLWAELASSLSNNVAQRSLCCHVVPCFVFCGCKPIAIHWALCPTFIFLRGYKRRPTLRSCAHLFFCCSLCSMDPLRFAIVYPSPPPSSPTPAHFLYALFFFVSFEERLPLPPLLPPLTLAQGSPLLKGIDA